MITLASIQKARHVYASVGTEAKMEIERDAVYWMLTHTEITSTAELRRLSQAFVEKMDYGYLLDLWEALKKTDVTFTMIKTKAGGFNRLELEDPESGNPWVSSHE